MIIVAGPNASGKTTIIQELKPHPWMLGATYINLDQIAEEQFGGWNNFDAVLKAAEISKRIRNNLLVNKKSIVFETVFSAPDKLEFIQHAKNSSYFIRLFFICTDNPEINIKRIKRRVRLGYHKVPDDKVKSRYFQSLKQAEKAVRLVDRCYFYDNSSKSPFLLFRGVDCHIAKVYKKNINPWSEEILAKLKSPKNEQN